MTATVDPPAAETAGVRAAVFDLGGVLVDWDPRHLYRSVFADQAEMEWFLAHVCHPDWNECQDGGRPLALGTAEAVSRHPRYAAEIGAFYGRWPEMLRGEVPGTVDVLTDLVARGVPCYGLSNWSAETFPVARDRFGFLEWFDGLVISGEVGVRKPQPEVFALACRRFGVRPPEALFVDDSLRNVEAARALGFPVHRFTDAPALRRDLVRRGLLGP